MMSTLTFIFIKSNGSVYIRNFLPAINLRGIFQVIKHLGKNPSIQSHWNSTCNIKRKLVALDKAVPERQIFSWIHGYWSTHTMLTKVKLDFNFREESLK